MFGEPIELSNVEANKIIDFLYDIFHRDFVAQKTYLNTTIYIDPKSNQKDDGKERVFWHLTTRKHKYKKLVDRQGRIIEERLLDYDRASRIQWVKIIIENHSVDKIKLFYYFEQSGQIRLYLWAYEDDFIVILEKLGKSSSYLVTSFYIDKRFNRDTYAKRYDDYVKNRDSRLSGCKWF